MNYWVYNGFTKFTSENQKKLYGYHKEFNELVKII